MCNLRHLIAFACCTAAILPESGLTDESSEGSLRPNIILLMGDDHGWDETGYNGHPHLKTPVLDEMAASGLRLDRFYAAHPSCSPTRGSVLTGRHPNRYGTFAPNWSLRPEEISIAHLLSKAGYACGHFGKWHVGPVKSDSPTSPGAMGFEQWVSHDNFFELNPVLSTNGGEPKRFPGESSEVIVREALRFAKKAKREKRPFLAVIWFGSPHEPYSGLEKDLALYDNLPAEYQQRTFKLTSNETGRPTKRRLDQVLRERYAEITAMDRAIGSLRNWLATENLRDNTLLWYCGDNGTPGDGIITSPFRGQKGTMYEGGIRVPCVIEWPAGISRPLVADTNAVTSDMLPTLCDLLQISPPERPLDGVSLKPLLDGNSMKRPGPIFFWSFQTKGLADTQNQPYVDPTLQQGTTPLVKMMGDIFTRNFRNYRYEDVQDRHFDGSRVALGERFKLVLNGKQADKVKRELFDVRKDPAEQKNVLASESRVAEDLELALRNWQESVLKSLRGTDYSKRKLPK